MSSARGDDALAPHSIAPDSDADDDHDGAGPDRQKRMSEWRKDMFGDCALIEIIHLHECLRGALKALEEDVRVLSRSVSKKEKNDELTKLERRVAGRFQVIWSVFRAHSKAEDEFIWPALQRKTKGAIKGSPKYNPIQYNMNAAQYQPPMLPSNSSNNSNNSNSNSNDNGAIVPAMQRPSVDVPPLRAARSSESTDDVIEQEEYEEDHADEERMFSMMDSLLSKLRQGLLQQKEDAPLIRPVRPLPDDHSTSSGSSVDSTMQEVNDLTKKLSHHLMEHLEKEEVQCMPLVVKHLSKSEIYDLVGKIMGKRSSDTIAQIMTMAVQNLNDADRAEMVQYMKQAMAGTFFDRWLSMSGWMEDTAPKKNPDEKKRAAMETAQHSPNSQPKQPKQQRTASAVGVLQKYPTEAAILTSLGGLDSSGNEATTSQAELEKHIRAIMTNQNLTAVQKNITIQGLRDSVWKSNQRAKQNRREARVAAPAHNPHQCHPTGTTAVSTMFTTVRRVTPPSVYFKKNEDGKIEHVMPNDGNEIPLFSSSELAPTYHDGAHGSAFGCPHYARACKLRHPSSGRLYTCRLCCEQVREMPSKDKDVPLDRYAVKEVMCMKCNALQPADDRCINPSCESQGKPFAKYFCRICHLYDDRARSIFHCPYCNTCRLGVGIGVDFFHCMRCNACVSMDEKEHRCIPQKLQGSCPICHESLFQSTEPLRGVKCGHVMHLACFEEYRRGQRYTCPLCMRSMEDMSDYFALLDAAVRMQPMPTAFLTTMSNIYCQDCAKTGQCPYHFVGQKCPHCGSYNTRELGRIDTAANIAP